MYSTAREQLQHKNSLASPSPRVLHQQPFFASSKLNSGALLRCAVTDCTVGYCWKFPTFRPLQRHGSTYTWTALQLTDSKSLGRWGYGANCELQRYRVIQYYVHSHTVHTTHTNTHTHAHNNSVRLLEDNKSNDPFFSVLVDHGIRSEVLVWSLKHVWLSK